MEKIKILIDTDPGDDIDDALALAYILKSGYFEVVGITTTFKDTLSRARMVKKICALAGENIPVYAGNGHPLKKMPPPSQEINQYTKDLDGDEYTPDGIDAVDFIIRCAEKYSEELVLVGIGPLCNLSRAILKAPQIMQSVQATVIMGGCFANTYPEWNMYCDPDSAKVVFEQAKNLTAVGVDITSRTKLSETQSKQIEKDTRDAFYAYIGDLVKMWRKTHNNDLPTLHDVLAIATLVLPNVCEMKTGVATIDADGEVQTKPGAVVFGTGGKVTYAVDFDKPLFMDAFMRLWNGETVNV